MRSEKRAAVGALMAEHLCCCVTGNVDGDHPHHLLLLLLQLSLALFWSSVILTPVLGELGKQSMCGRSLSQECVRVLQHS